MNDNAFYSDDGSPVIPLILFLAGMPMMAIRSIVNGRVFAWDWWDLHWRMFCAARLRDRQGRIVWWRPVCGTCSGSGWITTSYPDGPEFEVSCPDCNDEAHKF